MFDARIINGAEPSHDTSERNSNPLIVVQMTRVVTEKDFTNSYRRLLNMKRNGLILLPPSFELLYVGPDADIQVKGEIDEHED